MIEADLAVVGISELATPEGNSARIGPDLGRIRTVRDAAVACRDGRIVFAGPEREFRQAVKLSPAARTVDARGGTVLPGFVDAHTHLPFAGWRESEFNERLSGATYEEIAARGGGILKTVAATRAASLGDLTSLVRARLDAMLELGTTLVEAKSGYGLSFEAEIKQLEAIQGGAQGHPVDVVPTFLGAHTVPLEHRGDRARYIDAVVREMLPEVAKRGLAAYADAFVDARAFSIGEARRILGAAREAGLGVRVHADQLADDGAAQLAAELGAASADHLEYVSEAGVAALARAGTVAVLLPGARFFLMQEAKPPVRRLIEAGVPVAVATDFNPGTCPSEAMGTVLELACLTLRLSIDEAIAAATLNAAAALGKAGETGSIEPGKRADLVVHAVPGRYHLIYRFGVRRVRTVIASGRVVVDEGRILPRA
ncbi:MAG TPA: imidazolonepropionase [Candidatus Polarisedimenticolaceae bacterium]|nr:imidazolonepropionase [Candidatus Polarisedimenticolaceae bacterium]